MPKTLFKNINQLNSIKLIFFILNLPAYYSFCFTFLIFYGNKYLILFFSTYCIMCYINAYQYFQSHFSRINTTSFRKTYQEKRSVEFIAIGSMKFSCKKRKCRKTRCKRDPEAASAENDRSRMQLTADTTKCKKIESRFSFLVIATLYQSTKTTLKKTQNVGEICFTICFTSGMIALDSSQKRFSLLATAIS